MKMENWRTGTVAAAVVNSQGGWKVEGSDEGRPAEPADFFPDLPRREAAGPTDDSAALVNALIGTGAQVVRKESGDGGA